MNRENHCQQKTKTNKHNISISAENSTFIHDKKTVSKLRMEGNFPNLGINKRQSILQALPYTFRNDQRLNAFPLNLRTRVRNLSVLMTSNDIVLEGLPSEVRQEKEENEYRLEREKIKLALFADDMVISVENIKESTKKRQN